MPKYGAGNLPPGMVPGGGGYGSGSGIPGQNAGNYGDYGYDMPTRVRSKDGRNWIDLGGLTGAKKNAMGVGGPGSYATYLSNTGQLNNPNVYVAPGETAFAATPDYTMYEDYKNGKIQFGMDGRTLGGLGHDLPYGTIYNGVNVNDPNGLNNNWGAGSHDKHGGVNLANQQGQGGNRMANYQDATIHEDPAATIARAQAQGFNPAQIEALKKRLAQGRGGGGGWSTGTAGNQAIDPYQPMGPLQTDPYQLPQNQISTVGNPGGSSYISGPNNGLGYTGLPGQIDPRLQPWASGSANFSPQAGNRNTPGNDVNYGPAGPRPQQPPPGSQFSAGQLAALRPGSMGRPPQSAFGQQNPTVFNQNFANTPAGRNQMTQGTGGMSQNPWNQTGQIQNPYQQKKFRNTVW